MGAQIAAHFANAGVPVLLLDLTADAAREGLKRARGAQAGSVLHAGRRRAHRDRRLRRRPRARSPTSTGSSRPSSSSSTSSARCSSASTRCAAPARIVSSNTSGIPIAALAEGRSDDFRRHWLGTHFFNPPRYLHLLELIPTPTPIRPSSSASSRFADRRLGKGVVVAKDTPNFIANHIGAVRRDADRCARSSRATTRSKRSTRSPARRSAGRRARRSGRWTSPASTSSRTSRGTCRAAVRTIARAFAAAARRQLIERGWIGEKAGQGFYKRARPRRHRDPRRSIRRR